MSRFPVRFRWDDVVVQSYASDVSESSLFVPCPMPPPAKTRLPLRLFLPDGREPEEVEAVVRSAGASGPSGFFCELVGVTPSGLERLRGAIPPPPASPEPVDGEDLLRDIAIQAKPAARAGKAESPLHDLVLGALDDAGQEVPVSNIMAPPGHSGARPPPRRAAGEPPRAPTAPPQITPVQPPVERRAARRAAVHFKLKFGNPRSFLDQHAEDISAGGIFVATTREIPVGTTVQLTLFLPDGGEPIETHARVARIARADGPEQKAGLGLEFLDENPALSARIVRLVETYAM